MQALPRPLARYLWLVYAASGLLLATQMVALSAPGAPTMPLLLLGFFVLLTYVSERTYLQVSGRLSQSLSTTVHLVVVLLCPPPYPTLITVLAVLVAQSAHGRKPLYKRAFNVCHSTLTVGLCSVVLGQIFPAGIPVLPVVPLSLLRWSLLVALYYGLDVGMLLPVFVLLERQSPLAVWRRVYGPILLPELAACTMGILAAVVWTQHPLLLGLFVLPVLALRAAFRAIAQAKAQAQALQQRSDQLELVLATGQRLHLTEAPAALLQTVTEAARALSGAAVAAAYLRTPAQGPLLHRVALLRAAEAEAVPLPATWPLPGPDTPQPLEGEESDASTLQVPLTSAAGEVLGLLYLGGVPSLSLAERDTLALLALHATVALENAALLHQAERARATAEAAVRVRDEFLTAASHDLRTPLTVIRGRTDLLRLRLEQGQAPTAPQVQAHVEQVGGATTRMLATVEEITDAAQLQMGQTLALAREPLDLSTLIQTAVESVVSASPRGASPVQVTGPPALHLAGDRRRLERVLENVIGNAVKYSPQGQPVQVRVDAAPTQVCVRVQDAGVGIPPAEVPHLFTHFYRASTAIGIKGTGIGLAGAKMIVEQHGGTIMVESVLGQGTTVTVVLPRQVTRRDVAVPDEWDAAGRAAEVAG